MKPKAAIENFIISYPKCGRTWLRVMIGAYLSSKYKLPESTVALTELTAGSGLPLAAFDHDGSAMVHKNTSKSMYASRDKYRGKRVLLLGRDVKDVLVSAYFQATRRVGVFQGNMSDFVRSDVFGAEKIVSFYDAWKRDKGLPEQFLFIMYEQMKDDPARSLKQVLEFLGEREVDQALVGEAVKYGDFEKMKQRELNDSVQSGILKAGDVSDPESFKVRKGKVGGYVDYLSPEDVAYIDSVLASHEFSFSDF